MLLARTQGAANKVGVTLRNASNDEQAIQWTADSNCRGLVIDLRSPGLMIAEVVAAIRQARGTDFAVVACGPHVHEASLDAARTAGCSVVATRGQFERDADSIIGSMLEN
jgi:DNA-binding NarL/FixJ family response regulator